jgi:hypothetical protein
MDELVVCACCARHVKNSEAACPFCRTKRVRVLALAIASAAVVVACNRDAGPVAMYGAPPLPPIEAGTTVTPIPPPDAGK